MVRRLRGSVVKCPLGERTSKVRKFRQTLLAIALSVLSTPAIASLPAFATTGDAAWFQEALTEPFRPQPASGTVDNETLSYDIAQLQPEKGGMYTLELMKQVRRGYYHILRIRFPHAGKFDGKTITFPLQSAAGDGTLAVFVGNKAKNYSKACEAKYICGRITFSSAKGASVPGYLCLHFRNKLISASQINGYFHATHTNVKRKKPTAMFD